ncbi:MAG TPA: FtsX-like permease family protein [Cyclobacteriaceae bacterium]|nr:FtsX-like permease family protein [Cyclobacteriaceae bacterium]
MIKSYFTIAWRNLLRGKFFTAINVFGLACGISVSLLMVIHLRHELSYDTIWQDHELIYRLGTKAWAKNAPLLATSIKSHFPEMENTGRFFLNGSSIIRGNDKVIPTQNNFLVDQATLSVFRFPFVYGNSEKALLDPKSIVITRDVSEKLFGKGDPTGKVIEVDDHQEYTITGVMENIPLNSHLKIETLVSIEGADVAANTGRSWKAVDIYVRFKSHEDAAAMAGKLRDYEYEYFEGARTKEELDQNDDHFEFHQVASIHLYSHREKEMGRNSDVQYIYLFSALAIFIILIASINFVNLFTARSVRRMKEIGVKKVMGASRAQLFRQFLSETFLLTAISTSVAVLLGLVMLPFYNELSGLALVPADLLNSINLLLLGGITIFIALLAGFYPSLVISRYKITESLSRYASVGTVSFFKKLLVTFQFVISCVVILLTVVVSRQMNYIQDRDIGMSKEGVVTVKLYGQLVKDMNDHPGVLKDRLLRNSNIIGVGMTARTIGERVGYDGFVLTGSPEEDRQDVRHLRAADEGYVTALGLTLLEGRNFLSGDTTTGAFIINEEAAKRYAKGGNIDELIGKSLGHDPQKGEGKIVGIVKDFNFVSLHSAIEPMVIAYGHNWIDNLLVRVADTKDLSSTVEFIRSEAAAFTPGSFIVFNFLDDQLDQLYETENKMFAIFNLFSILSVIIAILGLVALSAHSVEARVKEIGIRKVLGATVADILVILSGEYMRLLVIASVLSIPLAWYVANLWLTTFAFKVGLAWWMFVLPCVALVLFTLLILVAQSLKPATADPVDSLRWE